MENCLIIHEYDIIENPAAINCEDFIKSAVLTIDGIRCEHKDGGIIDISSFLRFMEHNYSKLLCMVKPEDDEWYGLMNTLTDDAGDGIYVEMLECVDKLSWREFAEYITAKITDESCAHKYQNSDTVCTISIDLKRLGLDMFNRVCKNSWQ